MRSMRDAQDARSSQDVPLVIADDGFWFGLGAFETIAVEEGRPVFLQEHLQLLQETLELLDIPADLAEVETRIRRELARPELRYGRRALKAGVTERNIVFSVRDNPYGPAAYEKGFSLVTSNVRRSATSPTVGRKTLCYADCMLEKRRAQKLGFDEPVFLGERGVVTEGATTNVFAVRDGIIQTAPVECGLRPGVVRGWVIANAASPVRERAFTLQEARECDELFVTNSLLGIMPARSLDDCAFEPGPVAKSLREDYLRYIGSI